jgi:hypothetical protein
MNSVQVSQQNRFQPCPAHLATAAINARRMVPGIYVPYLRAGLIKKPAVAKNSSLAGNLKNI